MGILAELTAQLESFETGVPVQTPESQMADHIQAICKAIEGVQLNIEKQEGYDYTPEIQALGQAVTAALKAHGSALTKAIKGITVNVEAPTVTVQAPNVDVRPEFEVNMPDPKGLVYEIERDEHERLRRIVVKEYVEPIQQDNLQAEYD